MRKNIIVTVLLTLSLLAWGAEISFKILEGEKENYKSEDSLLVEVNVTYQNRLCDEGINVTKIYAKGMEIIKKEEWHQETQGHWKRRLAVVVTGKKLQLTAVRRTDKESGFGVLKLISQEEGDK